MRTFWKTVRIAVQRSPQDSRSRKFLLRLATIILFVLAFVIFYGFLFHFAFSEMGPQAIIFYAVLFAPAIAGFYFFRRSSRKENELLTFSLTGDSKPASEDGASADDLRTANYLLERAIILSCLVCRTVAEVQSRQSNIEEPNTIMREKTNGLLRKHGLWDKLDPVEASLCSSNSGSWPIGPEQDAVSWCEQVRTLRWVLGFDSELAPLPHLPTTDPNLAWNLLQNLPSLGTPRLLAPWSIRAERDIASQYFCRIYLELRSRNLLKPGYPDLAITSNVPSWNPSNDLLAGSQTVGDLDNEQLSAFAHIVTVRQTYLSYLLALHEAPELLSFSSWQQTTPKS